MKQQPKQGLFYNLDLNLIFLCGNEWNRVFSWNKLSGYRPGFLPLLLSVQGLYYLSAAREYRNSTFPYSRIGKVGKSLSVREEEEERGREQYLKGSVQLVHLSELVSFGEIELGSHCQITGILLQGPVQSIQGLAQTHTVNIHCQHKLKHTHRWTSTHREQLSSQSWVFEWTSWPDDQESLLV